MSECKTTRAAIHERLDGETLSTDVAERLDRHLASCSECREFERDMSSIQGALRGLELPNFPDTALQRVKRETAEVAPRRRWGLYGLAAAAALAAVLIAPQLIPDAPSPSPTRAEVQQAADEARMVFALTARAMRKTEQAAFGRVLADEVAPALERVPVAWPERPESRRDRT